MPDAPRSATHRQHIAVSATERRHATDMRPRARRRGGWAPEGAGATVYLGDSARCIGRAECAAVESASLRLGLCSASCGHAALRHPPRGTLETRAVQSYINRAPPSATWHAPVVHQSASIVQVVAQVV